MADTREILRDAEPRTVSDTGLALVDPHHSRHAVLTAGDQRFADDGDHRLVEQIPVVPGENPLLLAENIAADGGKPARSLPGFRDFKRGGFGLLENSQRRIRSIWLVVWFGWSFAVELS
jgi:hypothetical protein